MQYKTTLALFFIIVLISVILSVAFYTVGERKFLAAIQRRKGPNIVGPFGLFQPIADGIKLVLKELLIPTKINTLAYFSAPVLCFFLALSNWIVIPFSEDDYFIINLELGILYILVISSINVYSLLLAGWGSNSNFALLGSLRAAAQMISYEVVLSLSIAPNLLLNSSLNIEKINYQQQELNFFYILWPNTKIFYIAILAETNRTPFDLPEAEAEIVAGYNVEYASIIFALFFLGEYCNMIVMSYFLILLYFGGWFTTFYFKNFSMPILLPVDETLLAFKIISVCLLFVIIRGIAPRYRQDQLMVLGWKKLLPFSLGMLFFISSLLYSTNMLPHISKVYPIYNIVL